MSDAPHTASLLGDLLGAASSLVPAGELEPTLAAIRERYGQPVHLAVLGPRGAGVSTLVNALLGARLSRATPGGAGGVPTWFLHGDAPSVRAVHHDGSATPLTFEFGDELAIEADDVSSGSVHHLEIRWPVPVLRHVVIVDAGDGPADASHADAHLLVLADPGADDAPAAPGVGTPSPVNTITVVTRGDEVGDAAADTMSVAQVAAADVGAIAVCGLLAEAAACLTDGDVDVLRAVASLPAEDRRALLASADRFETRDAAVPATDRARVARRLGYFGVRTVIDRLVVEPGLGAPEIRSMLHRISAIDAVTSALRTSVLERAELLRVATAIGSLQSLAHRLGAFDRARGTELERAIARTVGSLPELDQVRVLHLAVTAQLPLDAHEVEDLQRLWGGGSVRARVALPEDAAPGTARAVVLAAIGRWRERGDDPFAGAELRDACATVMRSLEAAYMAIGDTT